MNTNYTAQSLYSPLTYINIMLVLETTVVSFRKFHSLIINLLINDQQSWSESKRI